MLNPSSQKYVQSEKWKFQSKWWNVVKVSEKTLVVHCRLSGVDFEYTSQLLHFWFWRVFYKFKKTEALVCLWRTSSSFFEVLLWEKPALQILKKSLKPFIYQAQSQGVIEKNCFSKYLQVFCSLLLFKICMAPLSFFSRYFAKKTAFFIEELYLLFLKNIRIKTLQFNLSLLKAQFV